MRANDPGAAAAVQAAFVEHQRANPAPRPSVPRRTDVRTDPRDWAVHAAIGQRIAAARTAHGQWLNHGHLARLMDEVENHHTDPGALALIERGERRVQVHELLRISDALQVPVTDLLGDYIAGYYP